MPMNKVEEKVSSESVDEEEWFPVPRRTGWEIWFEYIGPEGDYMKNSTAKAQRNPTLWKKNRVWIEDGRSLWSSKDE